MAIRCDDCRFLFPQNRSSCPFCGGRIHQDTRPDRDLLADGFTMAPQGRRQKAADPYEAMRQAYEREQRQPPRPTPPPTPEPQATEPPQGGVDFFAQFQTAGDTASIPTVAARYPSPLEQDAPRRPPDPYAAELRELERQQRRLDRQYRRTALWSRLTGLRWGTILRAVLFVLAVVAAIALWNMRYVILDSILNFLVGLLPIALLLWGIWMLLRSVFR